MLNLPARRTRPVTLAATALAAVAMLAACGGGDKADANARQIDLAPSKPANPQLADAPLPKAEPAATPERKREVKRSAPLPRTVAPQNEQKVEAPAPAPVAAVPAPAPPPAPTTGTVPIGTSFTVKPATKICTNTHKPGDRFTATLASAVDGSNGAEIPAGAVAILRIVDAPTAKTPKDSARLTFDILSVRVGDQTYEVNAHVTQSAPLVQVNAQSTGDKLKKVGIGAAIGAIAGRVLGGNTKGTIIGGAVGAAAGAAAASSDNHYQGCLQDDGAITLALDKPLVLKLTPQAP